MNANPIPARPQGRADGLYDEQLQRERQERLLWRGEGKRNEKAPASENFRQPA